MLFFRLLIACFFVYAMPAMAQSSDASSPATAEQSRSENPPASTTDELIRILENESAREELIARLRNTGEQTAQQTEKAAEPQGLFMQIAEYTRGTAEALAFAGEAMMDAASDVGEAVSGAGSVSFAEISDTLLSLFILAGVMFGVFLFMRLLSEAIHSFMAKRFAQRRWPLKVVASFCIAFAEVAAVLVAWGAAYGTSLYALGAEAGRMPLLHSLLLNAFLIIEIIKSLVRFVLEPRHPQLRLLPLGDTSAAYWYFWMARLISLVGYGLMFVVPALAANLSPALAQVVHVITLVTAVIIGVLLILQNRAAVEATLSRRAACGKQDMMSRTLAIFGRYWHLIAIAYLIALVTVWLVNPLTALPFMLKATAQTIIAVIAGNMLIAFISRLTNAGIRVPQDIRERLPLLEQRLQAFVPRTMQVVRITVMLIGVLIIASIWNVVDFLGWIASTRGQIFIGSVVSSLLVVFVGFVIYLGMSSWVEYKLNPRFGTLPTSREKTLLSLFRNAFTIALSVMVVMLALAQIGVNIAPLLAGAGVLGLAIGFGAQKFVQDIITGVFIQLENVMNEGDVVQVGGKTGVVEKLTIRSVSIRDLAGAVHLIPFSSIDTVSNMVQGFSFHVAEIGVAYRENITEVKQAMQDAFVLLKETEHQDKIIGDLEMHGLTAFGDSAITIRARIKTLPGANWPVGRAYNEFIKQVFDERNIEMPFPHVTLYMGEDKAGKAPPLNLVTHAEGEPKAQDDKAVILPAT